MNHTLTTREVADLLRVTDHTLRVWRGQGKGPPWKRVEGVIRYVAADVMRWLETRTGADNAS